MVCVEGVGVCWVVYLEPPHKLLRRHRNTVLTRLVAVVVVALLVVAVTLNGVCGCVWVVVVVVVVVVVDVRVCE